MKKLFVLILLSVVMLSGCGESEEEKAHREGMEAVETFRDEVLGIND
jgi:uncharacterized lipoprotein YehR (DUF1307 family)|tara:strand:+ start:1172 stop:1312 length:141 start_codon:yes stop_codon:yes gene_type:complete